VRKTFFLLGCLATVVLTGCTSESNRPVATGEGSIRAINAIKTSPALNFLIEERRIGNVDYKFSTTVSTFDDLEYTFNFETRLAGDLTTTRVASQLVAIEKDTDYTFLVSGALAAPDITVWELPHREWTGSETVFELRVANTADSLGDVDVYFSAPGIPPASGNSIGTLAFGEVLPAADYESGDYVLTYTVAGDPSMVRFESADFFVGAQSSLLLSIFDGDANDTGMWSARAYFAPGGAGVISGVNATATVRFYHATTALLTADIYAEETLTPPPVVANHVFATYTDDIDFPFGTNLLFYTAAGNSGAPLLDTQVVALPTGHRHVYIVGDSDPLQTLGYIPDRRSIETQAKFTFMNTALNHPFVDVYVVESGADITDTLPVFFNQSVGAVPNDASLPAGSFEMYLTLPAEKTIITGPFAFDTLLGDVFEFIAYDDVTDPMTADLVSIPIP
jgi:hypothetical protein